MDPFSAAIFAGIVTWLIMRAVADAGISQARSEGRTAREAILDALRDKGTAAGTRLAARLEEGRKAGPVYPLWWAWAAARTGGALRKAMRRRRQAFRASGRKGRRGGAAGRILGAMWRGGRLAARQAWKSRPKPQRVRLGVCDLCAEVVAATALEDGLCVGCRPVTRHPAVAEYAAGRDAEPDESIAGDGIPDAVVLDDPEPRTIPDGPVCCVRCGQPLAAFACLNRDCFLCPHNDLPETVPDGPAPATWRMPVRVCTGCGSQLMPGTWHAVNATNADVCTYCALGYSGNDGWHDALYPDGATRQRSDMELAAMSDPFDAGGNPVPLPASAWRKLAAAAGQVAAEAAAQVSPPDDPAGPTQPGQAAPPPREITGEPVTCVNGELHTQADWEGLTNAIKEAMAQIGDAVENTLRCLSAKNASRSQMAAVQDWGSQVTAVLGYGTDLVDEVNARQDPYVEAVQAAGGSDEVADADYYAEI